MKKYILLTIKGYLKTLGILFLCDGAMAAAGFFSIIGVAAWVQDTYHLKKDLCLLFGFLIVTIIATAGFWFDAKIRKQKFIE